MSRVKLAFTPEDYDSSVNREDVTRLFEQLRSWAGDQGIPKTAAGFAIVARDPKLALHLAKVSDYMTLECPWTSERTDLRELSIQALNLHFQCDYNFQSHLGKAEQRFGVSAEMQAAIPYWKVTSVFDEEQRLVIEFTFATVTGEVSDELFERVVGQFGEMGAIELTVGIAWWSFWAMIVGAIRPEHDFGHGTPTVRPAGE